LLERIVADLALLQRYRNEVRVILDQSFEPQRLCEIIDAKYELIKQDLNTDPFPHQRVTVPTDRSYDDIVASIKEFVRRRHATAVEQLEHPGPRPEIVHRQPDGGPGGLPPQLARAIGRIEQRARQLQRNGQDVTPIAKLMQRLGPLIQQGKRAEAEKVIQQALKLVGEQPSDPDSQVEIPRQ
jgi:hypothetical protein